MRRVATFLTLSVFVIGLSATPHSSVAVQSYCVADEKWLPHMASMSFDEPNPPTENECGFYQWAWQAFLFVTEAQANGVPRFALFETMSELFGSPAARFSNFSAKQLGRISMAPRLDKEPGPIFHEGVGQADGSILTDRSGQPLYYAIHMNPGFSKFVRDHQLNDKTKLKDADPELTFDEGSLEIKSAWQLVDPKMPPTDRIVVDATVPTLSTDKDGRIVVDVSKPRQVKAAMLGIHIVGRIKNHPEFVWATFEHASAGVRDIGPAPTTNPKETPPTTVISSKEFPLYSAGTTAADGNVAPGASEYTLNAAKQTIAPIRSVYRAFPGSNADEAELDDEVEELNKSVGELFQKKSIPTDVRNSYRMVGAVWINDQKDFLLNTAPTNKVLAGENALSNLAMESFSQTESPNCFACHKPKSSGGLPAKKINVSHVLVKFFSSHK
jgi:hypothetical protein